MKRRLFYFLLAAMLLFALLAPTSLAEVTIVTIEPAERPGTWETYWVSLNNCAGMPSGCYHY